MVNKVAYNTQLYGGFHLSMEAIIWLKKNGLELPTNDDYDKIPRHSKLLIECITELGPTASGAESRIRIARIEGNRYRISNHNGEEDIITPEEEKYIEI